MYELIITPDGVITGYKSSQNGRYTQEEAYRCVKCNKIDATIEEFEIRMTEIENEKPMQILREIRDEKIAKTDWRFRSDLTPSQAWIDYCQALRDLPSTAEPMLDEDGNLTNVTWPEEPVE